MVSRSPRCFATSEAPSGAPSWAGPMPRYLDEPYALQLAQIDQARDLLRVLSAHAQTPLPQRLRSAFGMMALRLGEVSREIQRRPDQLSHETQRPLCRSSSLSGGGGKGGRAGLRSGGRGAQP